MRSAMQAPGRNDGFGSAPKPDRARSHRRWPSTTSQPRSREAMSSHEH